MYYHVVRFCHGRIRTGMYSVGLQLAHDDDAIDTMATKRQVKMILKNDYHMPRKTSYMERKMPKR